MEDFRLDVVIGEGAMARTMKIDLPPFTLIGATTRPGPAVPAAPRPLRDHAAPRLLRRRRLSRRSSNGRRASWRITITPEAAREIGARSRGTPRIANRLLRRLRDFAEVGGKDRIDLDDRARGARAPRGRRARLRRARPADPLDDHREVRRRSRRDRLDRRFARRGPRHSRGPLRALPPPGRFSPAHPARPGRLARRRTGTSGSCRRAERDRCSRRCHSEVREIQHSAQDDRCAIRSSSLRSSGMTG